MISMARPDAQPDDVQQSCTLLAHGVKYYGQQLHWVLQSLLPTLPDVFVLLQ